MRGFSPSTDGSVKRPTAALRFAFRRCDVLYVRLTPQASQALHSALLRNRLSDCSVKVRLPCYASSFVVAAYCQYASSRFVPQSGSAFYETASLMAFYDCIKFTFPVITTTANTQSMPFIAPLKRGFLRKRNLADCLAIIFVIPA